MKNKNIINNWFGGITPHVGFLKYFYKLTYFIRCIQLIGRVIFATVAAIKVVKALGNIAGTKTNKKKKGAQEGVLQASLDLGFELAYLGLSTMRITNFVRNAKTFKALLISGAVMIGLQAIVDCCGVILGANIPKPEKIVCDNINEFIKKAQKIFENHEIFAPGDGLNNNQLLEKSRNYDKKSFLNNDKIGSVDVVFNAFTGTANTFVSMVAQSTQNFVMGI
jgi:hypothetical protein